MGLLRSHSTLQKRIWLRTDYAERQPETMVLLTVEAHESPSSGGADATRRTAWQVRLSPF